MEPTPTHLALSNILDLHGFEFSGEISMPLQSPMYCRGFIASFIHFKIPEESRRVVPYELLEWATDEELGMFARIYYDRM